MQGPARKNTKNSTFSFLFIFLFLGLNSRDFENLKLLLHEVMMIYVPLFFLFGGRCEKKNKKKINRWLDSGGVKEKAKNQKTGIDPNSI